VTAANNLEALINLEQNLKSQYEDKLSAASKKAQELEENLAAAKATIEKQLTQITELSSSRVEQRRQEQENRELTNRNGNLQKEIDNVRAKSKGTQKELIECKATIKKLTQLDAEKLKKNLVATKSKLVEQRTANTVLSKKNKELKIENSELTHKNKELDAELEALKAKETEKTKKDTDNEKVEAPAKEVVEEQVEEAVEA